MKICFISHLIPRNGTLKNGATTLGRTTFVIKALGLTGSNARCYAATLFCIVILSVALFVMLIVLVL